MEEGYILFGQYFCRRKTVKACAEWGKWKVQEVGNLSELDRLKHFVSSILKYHPWNPPLVTHISGVFY